MSGNLYPKYYKGENSLEVTQRNCKVEQQDKFSILKKIELGSLTDEGGKKANVNIATFDHVGLFKINDILNELKFIDISTQEGRSDAVVAAVKYKLMFDCRMFVEDVIKDVSVFGRKNSNI